MEEAAPVAEAAPVEEASHVNGNSMSQHLEELCLPYDNTGTVFQHCRGALGRIFPQGMPFCKGAGLHARSMSCTYILCSAAGSAGTAAAVTAGAAGGAVLGTQLSGMLSDPDSPILTSEELAC